MKLILGIAFSILLLACGGGGGSNSSSTPAVNNVSAQGFWQGTSSTGYISDLIILPNNHFYNIYGTNNNGGLTVVGFDSGSSSVKGNIFTGSLTEYLYTGQVFTGNGSSTVIPNTSITGSTSYSNGNTSSFAFTPLSGFNYNTPALISAVSGNWSGTMLNGTAAVISVASNGAVTGSNAGCPFSGSALPDSSNTNFFNVSVNFGAGTCSFPGQIFTGIAINYPTKSGTTQLLVAVTNAANTYGALFMAQR